MQLGPWWVDTYTARLVGACTLAVLWLVITAPQQDIAPPEFAVWVGILTVAAVAAGRAGYVGIHRDYFEQHPTDILRLGRVGGLNGASAWGGGLLAMMLWAKLAGHRLQPLISWLSLAALLVAIGAWSGCMHTGCAWGREAQHPPRGLQWLVTGSPDLMRSVRPRYAVRTAGLIAALLTAGGSFALGSDGAYALAPYLAIETGLTLLRGNPVVTAGFLRGDTLFLALWTTLILIISLTSSSNPGTDPTDTQTDTLDTLD
jgi:hypothetical protein